MTKKFFTKASPKAVEGIRRAYSGTGAKISAVLDPSTGRATVVVAIPDDKRDQRQHDERFATEVSL